ncbi:MAG: hypothetical protein JWQ71_1913 [Pedosphaera sp.]|nr:hypothetical protein [Pedosphaera sp.]
MLTRITEDFGKLRDEHPGRTTISIGIIAWNEEKAIGPALESLFQQSLFEKLCQRGLRCELVCVANGCTDRTPAIAAQIFDEKSRSHPYRQAFAARALDIKERGKINAWNLFVHNLSEPEAEFLFLMDADILFLNQDTLWNMFTALEENSEAAISTDRPCKSIEFKENKSLLERFSLRASQMTQAGEAQLCGQLYCIRSEVARRIYLPRDLAACEDGFIKAVVCTDFLTHKVEPGRIVLAKEAAHAFEAYTSPSAILRNQKRQMIGQAIVHILVDDYLKTLSLSERLNLADTLQQKEGLDPFWLKRLIGEHIRHTKHFWELIPGLVSFRFKRLARLSGIKKLICLPTALAGFAVSMVSCFMAYAFLKQGSTNYWPHGKSPQLATQGAAK